MTLPRSTRSPAIQGPAMWVPNSEPALPRTHPKLVHSGECAAAQQPGTGARPWVIPLVLVLATLLPRLALFFFNENLYGDAAVRTDLARQWLQSPHWIHSFA